MERACFTPIRPAHLVAAWQERADYLHQFGDPNSARLWRLAGRRAGARARSIRRAETLTLADAAKVFTDRPHPANTVRSSART